MRSAHRFSRRSPSLRPRARAAALTLLGVLGLAGAVVLPTGTSAAATAPLLGTSGSFAVLASSTVTNTGPSVIGGDLGVSPGAAVTGFPPGIVNGVIHANDAVAAQAQADSETAYNALTAQACDSNLTGQDLGGLTLTPGAYCFSTSAQLTGQLTLDAGGDPGAVFVFQIGSTLTTASASSVLLVNGGNACNVFWQVGTSATLGTDTDFAGTVVARASITATTGTDLVGRLHALDGAVTLDTNDITMTSCAAGPTTTSTAAPTTTTGPTTTSSTAPASTTTTTTDGGTTTTTTAGEGTTTTTTTGEGTTTTTPDGGGTTTTTAVAPTTSTTTVAVVGATSTTSSTTAATTVPTSTATVPASTTTTVRVAAVGTPPRGTLPRTGSAGTVPLALLGALSVVVGAIVVRVSTVRRHP